MHANSGLSWLIYYKADQIIGFDGLMVYIHFDMFQFYCSRVIQLYHAQIVQFLSGWCPLFWYIDLFSGWCPFTQSSICCSQNRFCCFLIWRSTQNNKNEWFTLSWFINTNMDRRVGLAQSDTMYINYIQLFNCIEYSKHIYKENNRSTVLWIKFFILNRTRTIYQVHFLKFLLIQIFEFKIYDNLHCFCVFSSPGNRPRDLFFIVSCPYIVLYVIRPWLFHILIFSCTTA